MIILDTNVMSAMMADPPEPAITAWLNHQARESMWTSSITVMEIRFGLEILAAGRRRNAMETALGRLLDEKLGRRIAEFDESAAEAAAALMAKRKKAGTPRDLRDTMIAAIAISRRAAVATRNVRHFADTGIEIVDPWKR